MCFTCAAPHAPPPICSHVPSPLHAACRPRSLAASLPPPGLQPAPHRVPCLRPSAARVQVQPAAELGHLPRHGHELHVFRALLFPPPSRPPSVVPPSPARPALRAPALPPSSAAEPAVAALSLHTACTPRSPAASRLPARAARPAPHALLATLGRTRTSSTRRCAGTPPASWACAGCLKCTACSPRLAPPTICSLTPSPQHAACAPRSLAASRLPARSSPRTMCPACDPRQHAQAFNQPLLSWDTSRVTNMMGMFYVR